MTTDKKIKILFLIGAFGTGGKERQLAELIKGLDPGLFELHLLIKSDGAHYLDEIKGKLTSFRILNRAHFGWKALYDIASMISSIKPDIVHSWAGVTSIIGLAIKLFYIKSFKLIDGSIRSAPIRVDHFNYKYFKRKMINLFSDAIVANSKAGLESFHAPIKKSYVIYNGFNQNRLKNLINAQELKNKLGIVTNYVVGMVARFDEQKDWPTFFSSAEKVLGIRRDVTFMAVGRGKYFSLYQNTIKEQNKNNIILTGERSDVESIVNFFDIGILSSYTEGISNSIMEYMALGKPVLASGTGGIPELVVHSETGFIYSVGDSETLFQLIIKLLNDSQLRTSMGESARKRIIDKFSFEHMVLSYNQLYRSLLCAE